MTELHMASMIVNLATLRETMARQGIANDEGLALHHFLSETFGKGLVQPFRLMPGRKNAPTASLYGYSTKGKDELKATADICALPEMKKILGLDTLESKIMPTMFEAGKHLGFDVRVRPVRRLKSPLAAESRQARRNQIKGEPVKPFTAGSEVDAFLLERMRLNLELDVTITAELPTREQVYQTWLASRFGDAVELDHKTCRMARYERRIVSRGDKERSGPDVTIQGELLVKDPQRLANLIAKGVGRHTAYGYGMLLLRPPGR